MMNKEIENLRNQFKEIFKIFKEYGTIVPAEKIKTETIDAGDIDD
jgi:hypothetical protein